MAGLRMRHIRKIYPGGIRMTRILFVLTLAVLLSGCAGIGRQTPGPGFHEEHPKVTITVWSPQEDQSNDNGRWLQTQCDSFAVGAVLISVPIVILFLLVQRFYVEGMSGAVKG